MDVLSSKALYDLIKHGYTWLKNLSRAKQARKQQSIDALRKVVLAARETAVYMRQVNDSGKPDHAIERRLSVLWTELGFALQDLGISKLAKRCQISGKHWSNPAHYDSQFLEKADVSLERMEKLALELLNEVE